jgi:mRNA interferase RelE/StbE
MPLLAKYKIAETDDFQKEIKNDKFRNLYRKITDFVYPQLRSNPFFGPNIKKLTERGDRGRTETKIVISIC